MENLGLWLWFGGALALMVAVPPIALAVAKWIQENIWG